MIAESHMFGLYMDITLIDVFLYILKLLPILNEGDIFDILVYTK